MSVPYKTSFKKFLFVCSNAKSATCNPGINELNLLSFNEQKFTDLESTQTELITGWLSEIHQEMHQKSIFFFKYAPQYESRRTTIPPALFLGLSINSYILHELLFHNKPYFSSVHQSMWKLGTVFIYEIITLKKQH